MNHLRLEQADKILEFIGRAGRAGYAVTFEPGGSCTVEQRYQVPGVPSLPAYTIVRPELRDAAAHALQILVTELDMHADELEALRERLVCDVEPAGSPERDLRPEASL